MKLLKRQGDILLKRIDMASDETVHVRKDGVIAMGETTGHAHKIKDGVLGSTKRGMVVVSNGETTVVHEEHDTLELEPGVWLVRRQVEYVGPDEAPETVYD